MPRKGQKRAKLQVGDPFDPRGLANFRERFLDWMRVTNYSERTIENRESYINMFIRWAQDRGITRPTEVTKPILERYQKYLYLQRKKDGQPMSFRSQRTRLEPLRAYFKWLCRNNHILYNPASEMELPRQERRLPKHVLTQREAETVINVPNVDTTVGLRDRAILETFYSTGMRRMELINLKLYDLDLERGTVMIRQGKGKKDRMIPIGERASIWVDKYVTESRPELVTEPDDGTVFLTSYSEAFTPDSLTQLVRNYIEASKIGKQGACHLFRHTMATLMLEHGADIRFIQQMLGHVKLDTTQIYTQVSIKKLKEIHTYTHPGARMKHRE